MNRIRAFIAVNVSVELVKNTLELQAELRQRAKQGGLKVAWIPGTNMHVTLKFLAEIPQESVWIIRDRLREKLAGRAPIPLTLKQVGAFPNHKAPRILWVGVASDGDTLSQLARDVDDWLFELGFDKESRPFHPHLTLGRVKHGAGDILSGLEDQELGTCIAQEVVLYQSVLHRQGAEYTPLDRFFLSWADEKDSVTG